MLEQSASGTPDPSAMHGRLRVAALLLAMSKDHSARVLRLFTEDEIKEIGSAASELGPIGAEQLSGLIDYFEEQLTREEGIQGTPSRAQQLIEDSLPKPIADRVMAALQGVPPPVEFWVRVEGLKDEALVEVLSGEHPQVIAAVLSRLDSEKAALVARRLDPEDQDLIFQRLLNPCEVAMRPMRLMEAHLADALLDKSNPEAELDRFKQVAGILNRLERSELDRIIEVLQPEYPEETSVIRRLLFRFEDVLNLSAKDRAALFEAVPPETMITALKGAADEIVAAALDSMSPRNRRMIEMELDSPNKPPANDIKSAQQFVSELAIDLSQSGKIALSEDAGEQSDTEETG